MRARVEGERERERGEEKREKRGKKEVSPYCKPKPQNINV
jgi:hypothetical protein